MLRAGLLGLGLVLLLPLARAEVVDTLYEAEVEVSDRSAAARAAAASDALALVLVKVSGSSEVLSNPQLQQKLQDASGLVQQFSYREAPGDSGLLLHVEFSSAVINELVTGAGAPLWTANRPSVLVWLVVEDSFGRRFVSPGSEPELAAQLAEEFARRGVPLQFPLFDLADAAALNADQAWRLSAVPIIQASQRYDATEILAGRVAGLSTGDWLGDWSFFSGPRRLDRSATAAAAAEFLHLGSVLVAEDLASRYAVAASQPVGGGVEMRVSGVESYADYAGVVSWLESLELIEHANVEQISGDNLLLRLTAQADAEQLSALIELNERLRREPGMPGLVYRWRK